MLRIKQRPGLLRVALAVILSGMLFVMLPVSASAAELEYMDLATINTGLTYPTDVAVADSGRIYVVDGLIKKVLIYDSYLLAGSISSIENPTAVAVFDGMVFIADNKSKTVTMLDSSGSIVGKFKHGSSVATFKLPRNIAVDASGNIYVVDQFADSIEVFSSDGSYIYTISGLSMPQDAVAAGDELFIIEQPLQSVNNTDGTPGNMRISRIRIFDLKNGTFISDGSRTFPAYGNDTTAGQFISLKGITADPHNNLYVNDSYLNVLYKYDTNGVFLGAIGEPLATPLGAAVTADGRLVVTSSYEGAVKVLGVDAEACGNTWCNDAPVADAGEDRTISEGSDFVLDGSGSEIAEEITSYRWTQKSGINILPANPYSTDSAQLPLTAPNVGPEGMQLVFELVVTNDSNKESPADPISVTVNNVISGSVVINKGALYTNDRLVNLSLDAEEAVEMRFANESNAFGPDYYAYAAAGGWTLSGGDGTKTVYVEFKDTGGNTTTTNSSIILDTEKPAVPGIVDIGGVPGEFNWKPVDDADSYTLQYASNRDFTGSVTIADLDFNGLAIELSGMDSGTWFWRVQSVDAAGNTSEWSDFSTFVIGPDCAEVPEMAQLALPFNNGTDIPRNAMLETNAMIYPAECGIHLRTEWQVSKLSNFSSLVMHVGTTLDNLVSYQVPALVLEPETRYFWRVKHVAGNGMRSDWSETWSFTTAADYDEQGEAGVLYVRPEEQSVPGSAEEIKIKVPVGDANIRIKAIRVSSGVITKVIQELDPNTIPDTINKPAGFPLGLQSFKLGVEPRGIAEINVIFSTPVPQDAEWYVYDCENGWHAYEGAVFSANRKSVLLTFQDGGIGDTDGVANGIIVNP